MKRRTLALAALIGAGLIAPSGARAQLQVSGQLDLVATARADSLGLNANLRGDAAFNPVRLRLFVRHWVNDRIGVFGELLWDIDASPRVNGAYVVINELAGRSWLNARLGLAPSLVGSFGLRSTYFNANPLIGVPLLWQYRTNLPTQPVTADELLALKGAPGGGGPFLYDSCWMIQWELMGEVGRFEYAVGMSPGAVSNPVKARGARGSQVMGRVGVSPLPGLQVGVSAAHGPWLSPPEGDVAVQDLAGFDQDVVGLDVEYGRGRLRIDAELFAGRWETPLIEDDLTAVAGYVETRFDILPRWYAAARVGGMRFGEIAPGGGAAAVSWDDDVVRTELAVGYRMSREVLLKADWQHHAFPSGGPESQNLFALQLSTVF